MKCKKCGSDNILYTDSTDIPDGASFTWSFYCGDCNEYLDEVEDIEYKCWDGPEDI